MKVKELLSSLINEATSVMEPTSDQILVGNPDNEVGKIAVCFKLTAKVLDDVIAYGANTVITHEGLFGSGKPIDNLQGTDLIKYNILKESGLTVFRFHDHAHNREEDLIHQGFIKELGLEVEEKHDKRSFAIRTYDLKTPISVKEIANLINKKLGVELVRLIGDENKTVKKLGLGLGWVDLFNKDFIDDDSVDLIISGEVGSELYAQEYIRDANHYGKNKCLIILGHKLAEVAGMRYFTNILKERGFDAKYFDSGVTYTELYYGK